MINLKQLVGLILLLLSNVTFPQTLNSIPDCSQPQSKQVCYVTDVNSLRLLQFNYGKQIVKQLIQTYQNENPAQYQHRLEKIYFPVIIAPDQKMYLFNNVELLMASNQLANIKHYHYKYYLKIIKNFASNDQSYTMQDFWQWLQNSHYVWLNDNGVTKSPSQLPKQINALSNDPYLTLAKELKVTQWCYKANAETIYNNLDFYWADYFRSLVEEAQIPEYLDPDATTVKGQKRIQAYLDYIHIAGICHVNVADKLPGFCQYNNECIVFPSPRRGDGAEGGLGGIKW